MFSIYSGLHNYEQEKETKIQMLTLKTLFIKEPTALKLRAKARTVFFTLRKTTFVLCPCVVKS